jgi:hypothetical protein
MAEPDENDSALPGVFGRRVGPLTIGAWALAGAAGLVLAFVINRRSRPADENDTADVVNPDAGYLPVGSGFTVPGGAVTATGPTSTGTTPPTGTTPTGYQTNEAWKSGALSALIAKGYPAVVADDALARYLESQQLTSQQAALVNEALQLAGPTPTPIPAAPAPPPDPAQPASAPTPAPAPAPAPAPWSMPSYLQGVKFVIGSSGGAVYRVTPAGLEWVPSVSAFYAQGGGGTVDLDSGPFTYAGNPKGTAPVVLPPQVIASLPKVGNTPPP